MTVDLAGAEDDDLVVEVFSAGSCDSSALVGCNDSNLKGDALPELEFRATAGATYFMAVGSGSETPPPGRFALRMDD